MGALTSNRKRGDDYFSFNQTFQSLYSSESDRLVDFHVSKKPRISSMCLSPDRPSSSKSAASRIHRYPEPIQRLRREVHAPCRITKFGFLASSGREWRRRVSEKEGSVDVMGNALSNQYDLAKSRAFDAFRYFKKDKEVIDVDTEPERDGVSDDSSIEDLEIVEDGREGRSVVSGQRSREINGAAVANVEELDEKVAGHGLHPSSSSAVSDSSNANMKVNNAGKMLDSLSLNRELDVAGVPIHKKLLEFAGRRNSTLSSLSFQINLNEKRWFSLRSLRSLRPAAKPVEDVLRGPFVPLTEEEEAEVSRLFSNSNRRNVLVAHENSNIEITGEKLQCLRPGAWLNDEVINLYLELLKEREKREPKKFLKCHFFSTFFYKKLISGRNGYDFKSIRRWTTQKKLGYGLIECDKIFVPIHKEIHWCLAVINKKDEKFQYLDSLKGMDTQVLKVLARYFVDEVKDKSGKDINVSSWKQEYVEDLPEQENGWDCGMFMIKYADFYSRGVGLCFNQEHMPYFRLRTAKEILRLKAD